jgi:hypothetical protein
MRPCTACRRHVQDEETACPFCGTDLPIGSGRPRLMKRLALGGVMLVTAATATACYGTPPLPEGLLQPSPLPSGQLPSGLPTPGPTSPVAPNPSASPSAPPAT